MSFIEILDEFSDLTEKDILASLAFAADQEKGRQIVLKRATYRSEPFTFSGFEAKKSLSGINSC